MRLPRRRWLVAAYVGVAVLGGWSLWLSCCPRPPLEAAYRRVRVGSSWETAKSVLDPVSVDPRTLLSSRVLYVEEEEGETSYGPMGAWYSQDGVVELFAVGRQVVGKRYATRSPSWKHRVFRSLYRLRHGLGL